MWILQNTFSTCVCVLFVKTLRLPSLRLAAFFLGLMFCYDIFMVFISPLIFRKSIMLEVATAGRPVESVSAEGVCERTEGDTFPMLFAVPHLAHIPDLFETAYSPPYPPPPPPPHHPSGSAAGGSWLSPPRGTFLWRLSGASQAFGMLGLGDIVLPALAIAFARRMDLVRRPPAVATPFPVSPLRSLCNGLRCLCEGGYYVWASIGYALGLFVTLLANTYGWTFNDVKGQPALLYLVPGVIGAILLRSVLYGETKELLEGDAPDTDDTEANGSGDSHNSSRAAPTRHLVLRQQAS